MSDQPKTKRARSMKRSSVFQQPAIHLLDLPINTIEKILNYAFDEAGSKKIEIACVCKYFYVTFCRLYEDKYELRLNDSDIACDESDKLKHLLDNVPKSYRARRFPRLWLYCKRHGYHENCDKKEVCVEFSQFLEQKGCSIRTLRVSCENIEFLQKTLSYTQHLKELIIHGLKDQLDLRGLACLTSLQLQCVEPDSLSNYKLRPDSLEKLNIDGTQIGTVFKDFITTQSSLKHVICDIKRDRSNDTESDSDEDEDIFWERIARQNAPINFFESCKLKSLKLCGDLFSKPSLVKILQSQSELTSFMTTENLYQPLVKDIIDSLGGMKKLKYLKFSDWMPVSPDVELAVTRLDVSCPNCKSEESLACFKKNFSNVKELSIRRGTYSISKIIEEFPKLEYFLASLKERLDVEIYKIESLTYNHENLKILLIKNQIEMNFDILDFLPNLTELDITLKVKNVYEDYIGKKMDKLTKHPKLKRICLVFFPQLLYALFDINFLDHHEYIYIRNWQVNRCLSEVRVKVGRGSGSYEIFTEVFDQSRACSCIITKTKDMLKDTLWFVYDPITVDSGQIQGGSKAMILNKETFKDIKFETKKETKQEELHTYDYDDFIDEVLGKMEREMQRQQRF